MTATFYDVFCIPAFFVLFRETLEAAVLIQVIIQYLKRKGEPQFVRQVWLGTAVASVISVLFMFLVLTLFFVGKSKLGGFAEMIVEGTMLGLAAIIISYFLVTHLAPGMKRKGTWAKKWEKKMDDMVEDELAAKRKFGFFFLSFSSVLREGFEAAVFVVGIGASFPPSSLPVAIIAGVAVGCLFGLCMFGGTKDLDLSTFFIVSAVFLAFVAAGLASHSSYEYQKGEVFGTWSCERHCEYTSARPISDYDPMASYVPLSDVKKHAALDLDVKAIETHLNAGEWDEAWNIYDTGMNSVKRTDPVTGEVTLYRTVRGFSDAKLTGEATYDTYVAYHDNNPTYADDYVRAALWDRLADTSTAKASARPAMWTAADGTVALTDAMAIQLALKGMQYQHTWLYVTHELYSALAKCADGNLDAVSGAGHAWDEGWAFWAGSLTGVSGRGSGVLSYTLADKRCGDFGTCINSDDVPAWRSPSDGANSNTNAKLLRLYEAGHSALLEGRCADATAFVDKIVQVNIVPLVQGALKYAYKADKEGGNETAIDSGKGLAEFAAFAAGAIPLVAACDADAAAVIERNSRMPYTAPGGTSNRADFRDATYVVDGYAAVKAAFESTYDCLGITCADIGAYGDALPACIDHKPDESDYWFAVEAQANILQEECEDDDEGGWHTYRRQLTDGTPEWLSTSPQRRQLTTRRMSTCDGKGQSIAWPNREVWDITGCCDTDNGFFFLLMVLFWYRPAATNLEVLIWFLYWICLFAWGYAKVGSIKEYNQELEIEAEKDHGKKVYDDDSPTGKEAKEDQEDNDNDAV